MYSDESPHVRGDIFIDEVAGGAIVEPGHPIVLAAAIMHFYPSIAAACKEDDDGYAAAVTDPRIVGRSCHVGAALRLLKQGYSGTTVDKLKVEAGLYWRIGQAGCTPANVAPGEMQADRVLPYFIEKSRTWLRKSSPAV